MKHVAVETPFPDQTKHLNCTKQQAFNQTSYRVGSRGTQKIQANWILGQTKSF